MKFVNTRNEETFTRDKFAKKYSLAISANGISVRGGYNVFLSGRKDKEGNSLKDTMLNKGDTARIFLGTRLSVGREEYEMRE